MIFLADDNKSGLQGPSSCRIRSTVRFAKVVCGTFRKPGACAGIVNVSGFMGADRLLSPEYPEVYRPDGSL